MGRRRSQSLTTVCTVYTALVIAGATAVYGVYQYYSQPQPDLWVIVRESGLQILAYAVLIYLSLSLILYRTVVRPVRALCVKLYTISRGDLAPVEVKPSVEEIEEIAETVNFLLRQMGTKLPGVPLTELSGSGEQLRQMAHELGMIDHTVKEALVDIANRMEQVVERLSSGELKRLYEESTTATAARESARPHA